jgi:hypothetical protein
MSRAIVWHKLLAMPTCVALVVELDLTTRDLNPRPLRVRSMYKQAALFSLGCGNYSSRSRCHCVLWRDAGSWLGLAANLQRHTVLSGRSSLFRLRSTAVFIFGLNVLAEVGQFVLNILCNKMKVNGWGDQKELLGTGVMCLIAVLGDVRFGTKPGTGYPDILRPTPTLMLELYLNLGHNHLLPLLFQFTTSKSSCSPTTIRNRRPYRSDVLCKYVCISQWRMIAGSSCR